MNALLPRNSAGLTRREVLVGIAVLAVLGAILSEVFRPARVPGRVSDQVHNGQRIYLALRAYAEDSGRGGRFPDRHRVGESEVLCENSNDALAQLLTAYTSEKKVFFNQWSAYCREVPQTKGTAFQLLPGECDWSYVRGLTKTSNTQWPVLANAFAPGTTTYVKDRAQRGGELAGEFSVVIWANGSAEVALTKKRGSTFYIPRKDKPAANVFEQDGEWLAGKDVKVLNPKADIP